MASTLVELFDEAVEEHRDVTAVRYDNGEAVQTFSYSQLQTAAALISIQLRALGCHNEVIGLGVKQSANLPALLVGIMATPAAFYSVDVNFPGQLICSLVERIGIRVMLVDSEWAQEIQDKLHSHDCVCHSVNNSLTVLLIKGVQCQKWTTPLAYVITTSGTTGDPKVVRVPHQCIVKNIVDLRDSLGVVPGDIVYQAAPLTFDTSIVGIFVTLSRGATLLVIPQVFTLIPKQLVELLLKRNKATVLQATPTLISSLGIKHLKSSLLCQDSPLRVLAFGGECCPSLDQLRGWRAEGNTTQFYNLYGITEVSCWASCHQVTESELSTGGEVPLGQPLLDTVLQIRDVRGCEATEGYLFIGSGKRICQIDNEPEPMTGSLTYRATGDWVRSDSRGQIYYVGRTDDQVKRHGKRMNLLELEMVSMKCPAVDQAAAACDEAGRLLLFLKCEVERQVLGTETGEMESSIKPEVLDLIHKHLPKHYHPDELVALEALPMTKHGKVDKNKLLEMEKLKRNPKCQSVAVWNEENIKQHIEEKWKAGCGVSRVAPTDNFIRQGGDSLKALNLVDQLECTLQTCLPMLLDLLISSTLPDIVQYVTGVVLHNKGQQGQCLFEVNKSPGASSCRKRKLESQEESGDCVARFQENKLSTCASKEQNVHETELCESTCTCEPGEEASVYYGVSRGSQVRTHGVTCSKCRLDKDISRNWNLMRTLCAAETRDEEMKHGNPDSKGTESHSTDPDMVAEEDGKKLHVELVEQWAHPTGKCVDASPLLVLGSEDSLVYIGSHSHTVSAVSMETGSVLWEVTLGDRVESSACLSLCARYVVVGCYDGLVYVLERKSGRVKWKYRTGGQVKSSPCLDPITGLVYIGSHDQHAYALDVQKEMMRWKCLPGGGSVFASACVALQPHLVYTATLSGKLSALSPSSGDIIWQQDVQRPVFSSPAVVQAGVCVGSVGGIMYYFNHEGSKIWQFSTEGPIFSSVCVWPFTRTRGTTDQPNDFNHMDVVGTTGTDLTSASAANQCVMFGSHDKCVYCLEVSTGELLWKSVMDSEVYATPFAFHVGLSNGKGVPYNCDDQLVTMVTVCSTKGQCKILDLRTGRIRSSFKFPHQTFSSPVVTGSNIVVGCRDENVYCLKIGYN